MDFYSVPAIKGRYSHLKFAAAKATISGHRMEFGVHSASSLNFLAVLFSEHKWWGFDSFKGLPEAWVRSHNGLRRSNKGDFSLEKPPRVEPNVELVIGYLEKTLPAWKRQMTGPISFMHIDTDLYSSCMTIFKNLNDQIVPGTVIVLDELRDWSEQGAYDRWKEGEWAALEEWIMTCDRKVEVLSRTDWIEGSVVVTK